MAKAFQAKNYFKKIQAHELIALLYKKHEVDAFFEITENTPRKNAVAILQDSFQSLPPEKKIDIEKELALAESLSTANAVLLFQALVKERKVGEETFIECTTAHDKALYYYLHNKEIFDEASFFHSFYIKPNYMLYEASEMPLSDAEFKVTELSKEFTRIANKEDRVTECVTDAKNLDGMLYVKTTFKGGSTIQTEYEDNEQKVVATRKPEEVRIVYLPKDKEVLISYTGSKYEKLIFLDTFLRIVCNSGYEEKIESFDLSKVRSNTLEFNNTKGVPLLSWKIKSVTVSFGGSDKAKRKMKLTLPGQAQENGLAPLAASLSDLGLENQFRNYAVENISLSFSFQDKSKPEKSVTVLTSVSLTKSSLCPLFFYHRYARALLKNAGVEQGFIEQAKKEKDDMTKKWEV